MYLDDISFSRLISRYTYNTVRRVLQRLLENRLFVKAREVHVSCPVCHVSRFGGFGGGDQHGPLTRFVLSIDCPVPDSRVALQRFLGFANFYRRFIRDFSRVAAPLTTLTSSKTRFSWSGAAQDAFERLKGLFTSAPILITPDPERQFIVEVDASEVGVGAILSQRSSLDNKVHRAPFTPIAFRQRSTITMSVTENFWRSVWLLVSGDTGSREPAFHSLSGRIIKIWSTSVPLRDLTPVRLVGLFSSAVLILRSRLDPAIRICKPDALSRSSVRQSFPDHGEYFTSALCGRGCLLGSGTGCWKSSFAGHQTSPRS